MTGQPFWVGSASLGAIRPSVVVDSERLLELPDFLAYVSDVSSRVAIGHILPMARTEVSLMLALRASIQVLSVLSIAGSVALLYAAPAAAQGTAASSGADLVVEEVVVTARKREESAQDVPMSITAFSAESLERLGLESVFDIAKVTPGLAFNQSYGRMFDRPVIRGMSQILGERTVAFVVDGVYIAGNISGTDVDDLEAVEVLKGPQAATFGRGSLAGVISYRTKRPVPNGKAGYRLQPATMTIERQWRASPGRSPARSCRSSWARGTTISPATTAGRPATAGRTRLAPSRQSGYPGHCAGMPASRST